MKKILAAICVFAAIAPAFGQNYVRPHVRTDGTVVQGHYKTAPDSNPYNNYSTQGNTNPYTGQAGRVDPYQAQQQYQPRQIHQPVCGMYNGQYICR